VKVYGALSRIGVATAPDHSRRRQADSGQEGGSVGEVLLEEILRTEMEIRECDEKLDSATSKSSMALGELLRLRTTRLELEAYLRGLKFSLT